MVTRLQVVSAVDGLADGVPPLDLEQGSSFGWNERMFMSFNNGKVFDYGDWAARELEEALRQDYKMRQLDRVLTGPLEAVNGDWTAGKGDTGECEFIQAFFNADEFSGGMSTPLDLVLSQMTSAIGYKKAFFEKVFTAGTGDFEGKIVYSKVAYRPATTCRALRDPKTGALDGFEQEPFYLGLGVTDGMYPIQIPLARSFVYVHGQRRDPINGVSDLEVPMWCFKTKQKILFLWLQFAERAALPKVVVTAQDEGTAREVATQIARTANSGVTPVTAPAGPSTISIQPLDISGKGGESFQQILTYLDQAAANSALAGFTNLTDVGKTGGGWALSSDASDFFLQTRQAAVQERDREIRRLAAPLVRFNYGPQGKVPAYQSAPLSTEDKAPQIALLQALLTGPAAAQLPDQFVEDLAAMVGGAWGLDTDKLRTAFQTAAADAKKQAALMGAGMAGQQVAGVAGAVGAADKVVKAAAAAVPSKA